ncbi:PAS domain S-box-containing protein [Actinoplanes regularis]|uniref:histidine kinase n=2 Tax=Actinoplanes regularis TaxID=52697 RepID=A0A238Z7B5_9ACTN|nr:PAS domain S-box-containing protein [Actinoplanes regularis]
MQWATRKVQRLVLPWLVGMAVMVVTMITLLDLVTPAPLLLIAALTIGPILAAFSRSTGAVLAVGTYTLLLAMVMAWRDGIWGSREQLFYVCMISVVTALSAIAATIHRRTRQLLEAGDLRLAAVAESSDDSVVIQDLDGTTLAWYAGAERMYGYRRDEMIGRPISLIMPTAEATDLPHLMERVSRGEHIDHFEAKRVTKDGTILDVSVNFSPIRDHQGNVIAAAAIGRNITDRKRAEALAQQIQQRTTLNERLECLGQLAGGVAHDFNNLLAVILNYTDFVAEELPDNKGAQADLARIRGAAERAQALVRQLLVFARREPNHTEEVSLPSIIKSTGDLLTKTLGEQIKLITKNPAQHLNISADGGQIEQVLLNLVLNARDAMPDGGTLVIEANRVQLDGDESGLQPSLPAGNYARLLVSDTGTGMSSEVITHAFEPFFTTKPKDKGVGLGLATVYGIVSRAGGAISIYSELGIGTTMRVYLPLSEQSATAVAEPRAGLPRPARGERALVVEDEPAVRDLVVRILERHGYHVVAADNGPFALEVLQEHPVDIVISDVIMPEMSGPELIRRLHQQHPRLPVVFMSGYSDGLLAAQDMIDSDIPLVQKPFTAAELLNAVHQGLQTALSENYVRT